MITLILATDMARHAEIMDSFKEKMENFDYSNEEHMTLVSRLVLRLREGCWSVRPPLQLRLETRKPESRPCLGVRVPTKSPVSPGKAAWQGPLLVSHGSGRQCLVLHLILI